MGPGHEVQVVFTVDVLYSAPLSRNKYGGVIFRIHTVVCQYMVFIHFFEHFNFFFGKIHLITTPFFLQERLHRSSPLL